MKTFVLALMILCFATLNAAEGLKIGDNAIDFSLKNVDGSEIGRAHV